MSLMSLILAAGDATIIKDNVEMSVECDEQPAAVSHGSSQWQWKEGT